MRRAGVLLVSLLLGCADALSLEGKHWGESVAFVLQYSRRDAGVQGEVVGIVGPSPSQPGFTRLKVVATEWRTR